MKNYIANLIPRLIAFSESLDKKDLFCDKPWVVLDNNLNQQKYIFRRSGDLIMSLNGQVTMGKWEYVKEARSLLIDRIEDKILLNQEFIDNAIMVLKKDGLKDEPFIMINEIQLPDLNAFDYLKRLFYAQYNISEYQLDDGRTLQLSMQLANDSYRKAFIEGETIGDCVLLNANLTDKYLIRKSKLIRTLQMFRYPTSKGEIVIEHSINGFIAVGDAVFQNNSPAPDGRYRLGLFKSINVKNGKVC